MNIEELREFCLSLPHAEECMPFGDDTLVFKVGGKMFLFSNLEQPFDFNIKAKPEEVVRRIECFRDAFKAYHVSKIHWMMVKTEFSDDDNRLKEWIAESYRLVASKLSKTIQKQLNLISRD